MILCAASGAILGFLGCSSADSLGAQRDSEELEVASYLEFLGVTEYEFDREENEVIVERDIAVAFADLLEQARTADRSDTLVEKGYWYKGPDARGGYTGAVTYPIQLVFDSNVPTAWKTAFNNAKAEWDANACITYVTNATYKTTVKFVALPASDNAVYARGNFPTPVAGGNSAGATIKINSAYNCTTSCSINNLGSSLKEQVALHEMGHTLGFAHPEDGHFISGTSANASTVMSANFGAPGIADLTADDRASRDRAYHKVTVRGGQVCAAGGF
jgi:predicted Zn-dependent protease